MRALLLGLLISSAAAAQSCSGISLGTVASLNGFVPFPASNAWNTDISGAALDPNNALITGSAGWTGNHLHHDFSSISGGNYGIVYQVVDTSSGTPTMTPINVTDYASESDVAYAPYSSSTPIEGSPSNPCALNGDQHVIVIDRATCMAYETWSTTLCNGNWAAPSETIWDLKNYERRPYGWTSGDAAGLPIFPGLLRYDEVAAGAINHAIRFTMQQTKANGNGGYFVDPATHAAGTNWGTAFIIGMRIRLKASFDISSYSATNKVILTAMKKYGMILADNGGYFFFQGTPDARWNDGDLSKLDQIQSSNFEVVLMTPTYPGQDASTAPKGNAPTITSFTATAGGGGGPGGLPLAPTNVTGVVCQVGSCGTRSLDSGLHAAAGSQVTLQWATSGSTYEFIDKLGAVHGPSVVVRPTATTTYTIYATNQYGRTSKSVTVTVP